MVPKVSIIIPFYNCSYVNQAIQSALNQTYKNIEIIVVDDGSTKFMEKIDPFRNKITYVKKKNGGTATALNLGIQTASGEYIAWLSSDDYFVPEKISKQISFMLAKNAEASFTNYDYIDKKNNVIKSRVNKHYANVNEVFKGLLKENPINGSTMVFKKDLVNNIGFFNPNFRYTHDYEMWLRMLVTGIDIHYLDEVLIKYRLHDEMGTKKFQPVLQGEAAGIHNYYRPLLKKMGKAMNILLVSYYPLPYIGGTWKFVSHLKEQLEHLGHNVDILSHNSDFTKFRIIGRRPELEISKLSPLIRKKLAKICPYLQVNKWIYHTEIFRYSLELSAAYYGLDKYDLIHAQDVIAAYAISRVKKEHTPLVTSANGYLSGEIFFALKSMYNQKNDQQLEETSEYQYYKNLEYKGYNSSDFIHTQSNWLRNNIIQNFSITPDTLYTFPYGMDTNKFLRQSEKEIPISNHNGKKVILFMGRLIYLKGVQHLIEALSLLKQNRNDWECWILGEGELQTELQRKCQRMNLANDVKFIGTANNVVPFLKQADIFVQPSLQDMQPYSVMEAQLCGLPVIVSNAAGLPEMVENGKNGFVYPVGNIYELSAHLNFLLDNLYVRDQLSQNAKEWAKERWSLDKMINNTIDMYKNALCLK